MERGGVVINADAMQVYRELRILTARPSEEDEAPGAASALWPCGTGADSLFGGALARRCRQPRSRRSGASGRVPIITGGTGLYFKALEQGLADIPLIPRRHHREMARRQGRPPCRACQARQGGGGRLNPNDRQRIIRALEVFEGTGRAARPLATGSAEPGACWRVSRCERIFLNPDRQVLYSRADERFARMVKEGGVDEVKPLLALGLDAGRSRS